MSKMTNREMLERAHGTLAYLDGNGKLSTAQASRFMDYVIIMSIEERLATFRWWKFWRWLEQRRLWKSWAKLTGKAPGGTLRVIQRIPPGSWDGHRDLIPDDGQEIKITDLARRADQHDQRSQQ